MTNLNPKNGGSMASEKVVSNHWNTRHNNPENYQFHLRYIPTLISIAFWTTVCQYTGYWNYRRTRCQTTI